MQIKIDTAIVINRPPAQVFARLTDIGEWPTWGGDLVSMEQISAGPLQVGSQIRQVTRRGRKPSESLVEVTELVPDQRLGIKEPVLEGTFTLDPVEVGTRLNARFEVEAAGLMALMYRLMLKQFAANDLRKFKKMVESREVASVS